MARAFNGTSQSLQSASALSGLAGKARIAIGFWIFTTFSADDDILLELSANSNTTAGTFKVIANESGSNLFWVDMLGNVGKPASAGTAPSSSAWHHVLINLSFANTATTEVESLYVDGSAVTLTVQTSANNTGTFSSQVLYVMSRANSSLFGDGRMADLCIWGPSTAIGGTDLSNLAAGRRASTIRNSEILHYWPLQGTTSPEPNGVGGIDLTVNGATSVSDPPALDAIGGSSVSGDAALSGTGSMTAAGTLTSTIAAALAGAAAVTAIASLGAVSTATLTGTGSIAASGVVGKSTGSSPSGTGTITADGSVAKGSGATLTGTGSITATGSLGATSGATLSGTGSITAAGTRAASTGASLTGTGSITADGSTSAAGNGNVNLAGTGTITAAGTVGHSTGATLSGTGSITTDGVRGTSTGASINGTGTITAFAGVSAGASLSGTGTLAAAGQRSTMAAASLNGSAALVALGNLQARTTVAVAGVGTITADGNVTALHPVLPPPERTYVVRGENRVSVVEAENRVKAIPPENRISRA